MYWIKDFFKTYGEVRKRERGGEGEEENEWEGEGEGGEWKERACVHVCVFITILYRGPKIYISVIKIVFEIYRVFELYIYYNSRIWYFGEKYKDTHMDSVCVKTNTEYHNIWYLNN